MIWYVSNFPSYQWALTISIKNKVVTGMLGKNTGLLSCWFNVVSDATWSLLSISLRHLSIFEIPLTFNSRLNDCLIPEDQIPSLQVQVRRQMIDFINMQ